MELLAPLDAENMTVYHVDMALGRSQMQFSIGVLHQPEGVPKIYTRRPRAELEE